MQKKTLGVAALALTAGIVLSGALPASADSLYGNRSCSSPKSVSVITSQRGNGYHRYISASQIISTSATISGPYVTRQTYGAPLSTDWEGFALYLSTASATCV